MKKNILASLIISLTIIRISASVRTENKTIRHFTELVTYNEILNTLTNPAGKNYIKDVSTIIASYAAITDEEVEFMIEKLHEAIDDCNLKRFKEIIDLTKNFNVNNIVLNSTYENKKPLYLALRCRKEAIEVNEFYKKGGTALSSTNGMTNSITVFLWMNAETDYFEMIDIMIKEGANIDADFLVEAITKKQIDIIQLLITKKIITKEIDINAKDSRGFTAINYAQDLNNEKIIKLLIDAGAIIK